MNYDPDTYTEIVNADDNSNVSGLVDDYFLEIPAEGIS